MIETTGSADTAPPTVTTTPHPGTAIRDSTLTALLTGALCLAVALLAGWTTAGLAGVLLGLGIAVTAGVSIVHRPGRWSGPADRVTLLRTVMIGGCATMTVLVVTGGLPDRPWWLFVLLVPTLALDAVDGRVARRTGTASASGGRLDGEMDAALLLVLSVAAGPSLGWWVLAIGLMRYVFLAAGYVRPRQRGTLLAFSRFRRVVAALQGIAFAAALAPIVPVDAARACLAVALALLTVSFGRDIVHLERLAQR